MKTKLVQVKLVCVHVHNMSYKMTQNNLHAGNMEQKLFIIH